MTTRPYDVPPVFGRRLRSERERRGLTLRQLGAGSGVNATTVLRAEQGRDVALSIALALAAALGLPLSTLLAELECSRCDGMPPAGFICAECGRGAPDPARREAGTDNRDPAPWRAMMSTTETAAAICYHPDPEINRGVIADALDAEHADLAAGYLPRRWLCICGTEHSRGHFGAIGVHRCLACGYVGAEGVMLDD